MIRRWMSILLIAVLCSAALAEADDFLFGAVEDSVEDWVIELGEGEAPADWALAGDALEEPVTAVFPGEAEVPEGEGCRIDEGTFPDGVFRDWVREHLDASGDGMLSGAEVASTRSIDVSGLGIRSLAGIGEFQALEGLDCAWNGLTELDVTACESLRSLKCQGNELTQLRVDGLNRLETLWCHFNELQTLTLDGCGALRDLNCQCNGLKALNIAGLGDLETLWCQGNAIESLDAAGLANLESLFCADNAIEEMCLSGCEALSCLACQRNSLEALDLRECPVLAACLRQGSLRETKVDLSYRRGEALLTADLYTRLSPQAAQLPAARPAPLPIEGVEQVLFSQSGKGTGEVGKPFQLLLPACTAVKRFTTSAARVATVDQNGLVTPLKTGKVRLTAVLPRGKRVLTLTVKDPTMPTGVELTVEGTTLIDLAKGETLTLRAMVYPADTAVTELTWKSGKPKICQVRAGIVTPLRVGKAKISVKTIRGGKSDSVIVQVIDSSLPKSIAFSEEACSLQVGGELRLIPQIEAETPREERLVWTSANRRIATVTNGVVRGVRKGSTTIRVATRNGRRAAIRVNVLASD